MGLFLWWLMCFFALIGFVGSMAVLLVWLEFRRVSKLIDREMSM